MNFLEVEISRRNIIKLFGLGLGSLFLPPADILAPVRKNFPPTPAAGGFSAVLEMPFASKLTVETKPPHPQLKLNRPYLQKLLDETVIKPTASIYVAIYSSDRIGLMPDNTLHLVSNQYYQSLNYEEKKIYMDGRTITSYDPQTSIPKEVAVFIAAGYYLKFAQLGGAIRLTNEFVPQGLITDPFVALNANFYHEVFGHALLRNIDYRKRDGIEKAEEEREAQFREIEWVKSLGGLENHDYYNKLFLIPSTFNP